MKLAGNYPASRAMKNACSEDCQVYVYSLPEGGYAFEVVGRLADPGVFVDGEGRPFKTIEAAREVADNPESANAAFYAPEDTAH